MDGDGWVDDDVSGSGEEEENEEPDHPPGETLKSGTIVYSAYSPPGEQVGRASWSSYCSRNAHARKEHERAASATHLKRNIENWTALVGQGLILLESYFFKLTCSVLISAPPTKLCALPTRESFPPPNVQFSLHPILPNSTA